MIIVNPKPLETQFQLGRELRCKIKFTTIFFQGRAPKLTHDDIVAAQTLRHKLHASPELSGEEVQTAKLILEQLKPTNPDWTMSNIGGHGVVAAYDSGKPGLNLLFRAELDALPIQETTQHPYKSKIDGKGHLCGHDGHTSILYLLGVRHQMKWVI